MKKIKRIICWLRGRHSIGKTYKEGNSTCTQCSICDYAICSVSKGRFSIGIEPNYFSILRKKV